MIKVWQFILCFLNCWSFCYQIWFDSTLSKARMSCEEIGLLCSRSRSQRSFKTLVNICPDDIFWTAEQFITKLGLLRHELKSREKSVLRSSRLESQWKLVYNQIATIYNFFWNTDPFATILTLMFRSGELRTEKLKSYLVRTQSLNFLPLKPGIGQYIAMHATLTVRVSYLLISALSVHLPAFFLKYLLIFACAGCG